ncbi:MAG: LysM peptidoglycan-binding domain-containing protein [Verrucomicrobiota bacterium]
MKPHSLPVRRKPASKGLLKRLSAVTNQRKQRVAATAQEMDDDDGSSRISRALTIIFLIHIVAIGLIFVHKNFLEDRTTGAPEAITKPEAAVAAVAPALPRLSTGEEPYIVSQGDNYNRIATKLGVDEGDLRLVNEHVEIKGGIILKIPPKRIVAQEPAEIVNIREQQAAEPDRGLVENIDTTTAPRAKLVRPNTVAASQEIAAPSAASGQSYTVKSGDSIWRIANRFKVDQNALMKANGISDARKVKIGMNLVIP